jgi:hypothetical protein
MYIGGKGSDGRDSAACTLNGSRNIVRGIANDCTCGVYVNNPDNTVELTVSRDSHKGQKAVDGAARPATLRLDDYDRANKMHTYYPARLVCEDIRTDTDELQRLRVAHGLPFTPALCEIVPVLNADGEADVAQLSVCGADKDSIELLFRLSGPAKAKKISVTVNVGI